MRIVHALTLIDGHVALGEEAVGEVHNLLLRYPSEAVHLADLLLPFDAIDEGVQHLGCARLIVVKASQLVQFLIVKRRHQQIVVEVASLQFLHFCKHEFLHLVERLSFLGHTGKQEEAVVEHRFHERLCLHHFHFLIQVEVEQACPAVREDGIDESQCVVLERRCLFAAPTQPYVLGFLTDDGGINRVCKRLQFGEGGLTDVLAGLPFAEVFLDDGQHLVGVEIACHTDGHIIGHIPLGEVVLDVRDGRILQVLLGADGGLRAVGVRGEELRQQSLVLLVTIVREPDIELLVNSLQLSVEAADDHILEAVGLHLGPVLHLVRWDVLDVAGHIVRSESVRALATDGRHQFVVLVGDEVLGCQLRNAVNFVVFLLSQSLVGDGAILLVALLNLVEQRSLGLGVGSAELSGALEHQVLQIMRKTGCLGRIVLRARAHGNISLYARFFLVDGEIDLQTIIKSIDTRLHGVALHPFIVAILAGEQTADNC